MDVLQNEHPWLTLLVLGEVPSSQCSTPDFFFQQLGFYMSNAKLMIF